MIAAQGMLIAAEEVQQSIKRRYEKGAADQNQLNQSTMNLIEAQQEMSKAMGEWKSARLAVMAQ